MNDDLDASPLRDDRAAGPSDPSPSVSAIGSIPSAGERIAYPDCTFCRGTGVFRVIASDTYPEGSEVGCGNCIDRKQWEGLTREPQRTWCVWTKTGRRPTFWHTSQSAAEIEAARLARKHPGKTFIVFEKLVNVRTASGIEAPSGGETRGEGKDDD